MYISLVFSVKLASCIYDRSNCNCEMSDRQDARRAGHKSEKGDDEWLTMKSRKLAYKLCLHCKLAASLVHLVKLIVKAIMKNTMNLLLLMCSDEDFSDAELLCDLLMICEVQDSGVMT